jgi:hypothetical protein
VEAARALGAGAFAKHPLFASPHYCAADLQSGLLVTAIVDAICERRGHKAGYEKDQSNNYQEEEH